jgi:general secretion pathway protein G
MRSDKYHGGFSLIELLVVATIMIVITTIGLVSYAQSSRNSRNAKRKTDLESVRQALVLYKNDISTYPDPVASDGTNAAFVEILNSASAENIADYISFDSIEDPKSPTYDYTYSSGGSTFELCATLETKTGTDSYCIDNP